MSTVRPETDEPTVTVMARRIRSRVPWHLIDRAGRQSWALVGLAALFAAIVYGLGILGWILLPTAFATVIAVLSAPVVRLLERRGLSRAASTWIVFSGIVVAALALVWIVVPPFVAQAGQFAEQLPDFLDGLADRAQDFEKRLSATNPAAGEAAAQFGEGLNERALEFADGLSGALVGLVSAGFSMGLAFLVGAIIAFLLVQDLDAYTGFFRRWLDSTPNKRLAGALRQGGQTVMAFVRGQLILATLVGVMTTVVLGVLGVPFFLPLGLIAAVGDLVPTIGPILAIVPAAVMAYADGGLTQAVIVVAALTGVQQIEAYVFGPLVVGKAVELSPLTVIVALTVAGAAFGLAGLIVAVPLVAVLRDSYEWFRMTPEQAEGRFLDLSAAPR